MPGYVPSRPNFRSLTPAFNTSCPVFVVVVVFDVVIIIVVVFVVAFFRKPMRPTQQEPSPLDKNRKPFEQDKERLIVLRYVKTSTVLGFQPLDWMENPERCLTMDLMSEGHFRTEALSAKRVR